MERLAVVVHPGAHSERVELIDDITLGVWVRARPVEGQANTAVEHAVAAVLGLKPRQVKIVSGGTARRKILEIDLPGGDSLDERLLARGLRSD